MLSLDHIDLFVAQYGRCFYCELPMIFERYGKGTKKGYTRDHFIPKVLKMGKYLKYNIVLSHSRCNSSKGHMLPTDDQLSKFHTMMVGALSRKGELQNVPRGGPKKEVNNVSSNRM